MKNPVVYPVSFRRKKDQPAPPPVSLENLTYQETIAKIKPLDFQAFNDYVGGPKHPATGIQGAMAPFQLAYYDKILHYRNQQRHKFLLNKSRQSGWSEEHLRIFAFEGFHYYEGWQCKIIAGTRSATTRKLMERLKDLFREIPEVVENNGDSMYLELKNGTQYEGLPAEPEAITGDTKIRAILDDESTKWGLVDDRPVLNAQLPIVHTNKTELFLIATPKGPRGFFYEIDTGQNDFVKFKHDIWITEGYLYSREEIRLMLADKVTDVDQEYLNAYTSGRNSVFGNTFATTDEFQPEVL